MDHGEGLEELIPPIRNSDYYIKHYNNIACIIKNGMYGPIEVNGVKYDFEMQAIPDLTPPEIANVLNYINSRWFPDLPFVKISDIENQLEGCGGL